ncbi:hypothetical protein [Chenggangzhangella methanolivorans]|uniref:Uncharacterized protein n=1 Tax=Chenggangzhangella methanolivorans TaxID=1437009 RepID=A0A9E6RCL6_9HYPH|nr:hypothetical protein [Chenggangzhangella methanolivorans]QZO01380.1 hypothetical protein K6K41_07935 [Chenggangzhangella methanolivorans]
MKAGFAAMIAFGLMVVVWPAAAEDYPMEAQRCIWRCLADSKGADDPAYMRCAERRCSGKPERKQRAKPERRSEAPEPGRWTYGEHRRLGLSAYVEVGSEAFGLAFPAPRANGEPHGYAGRDALHPRAVALARRARMVRVHLERALCGRRRRSLSGGRDLFEIESDYCGSDIARIRSSGTLLLLKEPMRSLSSDDGVTRLALDGAGGPLVVETAGDLARLDSPTEVPLAGASRAIAQLAKNCAPLRRQMAEGCDVD